MKMQFLALFLHLCVVIVIPNIHVKDHFDWPIRLFSESDVNNSKFSADVMAAAARKPQFYFLLNFSKSETLGQV